MNSKNCCFNLSKALISENIKRFRLGSLLAFIGYICIMILPMAMGKFGENVVSTTLSVKYIPFAGIVTLVPVVAALFVFNYLQHQSSSSIVHALPYSRKQLFNSNCVSGLILCLVPVIMMTLIFIMCRCVTGPVEQAMFDPQTGFTGRDVFSFGAILNWSIHGIVMTIAVFALSALAAVLSGSTVVQLVLSFIFIFLIPGVTEIISKFCDVLLYGYFQPEWIEYVLRYGSPVFAMIMSNSSRMSEIVPGLVYYPVISAVIFAVSMKLYRSRHMEKAGDAIVFNKFKPLVTYLVTFVGMSLFALFIYAITPGKMVYVIYIGAFGGALLSYVAVEMIMQKSLKIHGFAKGFIVYLVLAAVFFGIMSCGGLGYEAGIPESDAIKSVDIRGLSSEYVTDIAQESITDQESIDRIRNLHKDIIEEKSDFFPDCSRYYDKNNGAMLAGEACIHVSYNLKNGRTVARTYIVPYKWLSRNESAKQVYESRGYKAYMYPVLKLKSGEYDINNISLITSSEGDSVGRRDYAVNEAEKYEQILGALKEDLISLKYNQMNGMSDDVDLFSIQLTVNRDVKIDPELNRQYFEKYGSYYEEEYEYYTYIVNSNYKKTVALLREWGMLDNVIVKPEDISHITVRKNTQVSDASVDSTEEIYVINDGGDKIMSDEENYSEVAEITDREAIAKILNFFKSDRFCGNTYYSVYFHANSSQSEYENCFIRCYSEETLPETIKKAIN